MKINRIFLILSIMLFPVEYYIFTVPDPTPVPSVIAYERLHGRLNFSWIDAGLKPEGEFVAGMAQPTTVQDLQDLYLLGVRSIFTLTEEPLDPYLLEVVPFFRSYHIPVREGERPTLEQVISFLVNARLTLKAGGKIAIHCRCGVMRTGFFLALWLAIEKGLKTSEARELVHVRRGALVPLSEVFSGRVRGAFNDAWSVHTGV